MIVRGTRARVMLLAGALIAAILAGCTPTNSQVAGAQRIRIEYNGEPAKVVDGAVPGVGYTVGLATDGAVSAVNGDYVIIDTDTDAGYRVELNLVRLDHTLWGPVTVTDVVTGVVKVAIVDAPTPTPKLDDGIRRIEFAANGVDTAGPSTAPLVIDVRLDIAGDREPTTTTTTATSTTTVTTTPGTSTPTTIPPVQAYTIDATDISGGQVGVGYERSFEIVGTDVDLTDVEWSVDSGELPPGLDLDEWGALAGTPTIVGAWTFAVSAYTPETNRIGTATVTVDVIAETTLLPAVFDGDSAEITTTFGGNETRETFVTLDGTGSLTVTACTGNPTLPIITLYDADDNVVATSVTSIGGGCVEIDPSVWPGQVAAASLPPGTYRITLTSPSATGALRAAVVGGAASPFATILQIVKTTVAVVKAVAAPLATPAGVRATSVAVGFDHTCALTDSGHVKCWGYNGYGQLGDGTTTDSLTPVDVDGLGGVTDIDVGRDHSCAVTDSGHVKCWGSNFLFGLGVSPYSVVQSSVPIEVPGLSGVDSVRVWDSRTCVLTTGGGVKCWGYSYGYLGYSPETSQSAAVDVPGLASGVVSLAAQGDRACAVTSFGGVKCWGGSTAADGTYEFTKEPSDVIGFTSGIAKATASFSPQCAVTVAATVRCSGPRNTEGQLGNGTTLNSTVPVDVVALSGVTDIATAEGLYSCALAVVGGVKCWGWDTFGTLGTGGVVFGDGSPDRPFTTSSSVPVGVVGLASGVIDIDGDTGGSCAVTATGNLKCWGLVRPGRLRRGEDDFAYSAVPLDVSGFGVTSAFDNTPRPGCAAGGGIGTPADFNDRNGAALSTTTLDAYSRMESVTDRSLLAGWLGKVENEYTVKTNPIANAWAGITSNVVDNLLGALPVVGTAYGMTAGNLRMLNQLRDDLNHNELVVADESMIDQTRRLTDGLFKAPTNATSEDRDDFYSGLGRTNLYKFVARFGFCPSVLDEGNGPRLAPKHRAMFNALFYESYFPGEVWATLQAILGPFDSSAGYNLVEGQMFGFDEHQSKGAIAGRLAKSIDEFFDLNSRVRSKAGRAVLLGEVDGTVAYRGSPDDHSSFWYPSVGLSTPPPDQLTSQDVIDEALYYSGEKLTYAGPFDIAKWQSEFRDSSLFDEMRFTQKAWKDTPLTWVRPDAVTSVKQVVVVHGPSMTSGSLRYVWAVAKGTPFDDPNLEKQLTLAGYRYPQAVPGGKRM